jgi:hypothetical protein
MIEILATQLLLWLRAKQIDSFSAPAFVEPFRLRRSQERGAETKKFEHRFSTAASPSTNPA